MKLAVSTYSATRPLAMSLLVMMIIAFMPCQAHAIVTNMEMMTYGGFEPVPLGGFASFVPVDNGGHQIATFKWEAKLGACDEYQEITLDQTCWITSSVATTMYVRLTVTYQQLSGNPPGGAA